MAERPLKNDRTAITDSAVSNYFDGLTEGQSRALLELRRHILTILPTADEVIKYNMPTYVVDDKPICGILANKKHIGFYPYSGSILNQLPQIFENYVTTKGAWHIPYDVPLPKSDVGLVIDFKLNFLESQG